MDSQPQSIESADRTLGVVATEPANKDFGTVVIDRIESVGVSKTSLRVYWDDIEFTSGVYAPNPNYLQIGELFYSSRNMEISLCFSVIDTNIKRLPPWLAGRSFDDPLVIESFNSMLDWAAQQMPTLSLRTVIIGNEVDIYLNANLQEWPAWERFYSATTRHARHYGRKLLLGAR